PVAATSVAGQKYLAANDEAVRWARANRLLIARRFAAPLGGHVSPVWDGCHNQIAAVPAADGAGWVHRKGAVTAGQGLLVIPGSRGTFSYLVQATGDGESHAWSLAHGAGRKWMRTAARTRMRDRFSLAELHQTPLGSRVICEDRDLLYEEAPGAYKNIEAVIGDLVAAGLIQVVATLRPLLTYKTRKERR
ncbi:MAG TPA: RtcB family protein, partial [Verrucomicrobiae bacterium]